MTIGWIGIGIMGEPMAGHLLAGGHQLTVYARNPARAARLQGLGAGLASTPRELATACEVIFTMVNTPSDVEQVYFGPDGVLAGLQPGAVCVDMSTSSPDLALRIAAAAHERRAWALDAPVSGGDVGAREARLAIMVGGDMAAFQRVKPLLALLGPTVELMGAAGAGQHTKMANQIKVAGTMIGMVESLLYAEAAGLDLNHVIDVLGSGAAASWTISNMGRRIAASNMKPGFTVRNFVKDMGIALAESRRMGIALPALALVEQFYRAAIAVGLAEEGTQSLMIVLRRLNNRT